MSRQAVSGRVATSGRAVPAKARVLIGNLVYNGDFEYAPQTSVLTTTPFRWIDGTSNGSNISDNVFGWGLTSASANSGAMFDNTEKYRGAYSMKLSTGVAGGVVSVDNTPTSAAFFSNNIVVQPSTEYKISGYIKKVVASGSATTGANIRLDAYDSGGSIVQFAMLNSSLGATTADWTYFERTFTTNTRTRNLILRMQIIGNNGSADLIMDAWFDSLVLWPTASAERQGI